MIYKDGFLDFLKSFCGKVYLNSTKTEIITFCPFCEGTHLNKRHGHMYIHVNEPVYYCQKCGENGMIFKLIIQLGGKPDEFIDTTLLRISSTHSYVKKNLELDSTSKEYNRTGSISGCSDNYEMKVSYLFKRFGTDIELNKIPGLVLSVKSFIEENSISVTKWQAQYIDQIDKTFIGFVSSLGTTITFRNCADNEAFRYYKLPLMDRSNSYYYDFYGLKTGMPNESTPSIVLAEGIFDILVPLISKTLEKVRLSSCYWAACLGKGSYQRTLISVLSYCKLVKANFHILSDCDVPLHFYKRLRDLPFVNNLNIYWNKRGKDFGVLPIEPYMKELYKPNRRIGYAKPSHQ